MQDENGHIPDIVNNNGNVIPAEIFFSKETGNYIQPFITEELDKELLDKLRKLKDTPPQQNKESEN